MRSSVFHFYEKSDTKKMSKSDGRDNMKSPEFLSWRKLLLSRAKLRSSNETSTLLSGFAMVALVELQIDNDLKDNAILVVFVICTTLLVAVHILSLMISTCILPNIEAVCDLKIIKLVNEAPHKRLHWYIEIARAISTLLGLLLFLAEIAIICWIKFQKISEYAAWSGIFILITFLVIFIVFAVHFYISMMDHKYKLTKNDIKELELLKEQIEDGNSRNLNVSPNKKIIEIV